MLASRRVLESTCGHVAWMKDDAKTELQCTVHGLFYGEQASQKLNAVNIIEWNLNLKF